MLHLEVETDLPLDHIRKQIGKPMAVWEGAAKIRVIQVQANVIRKEKK